MAGFAPQFDVVRIDADGFRVPVAALALTATNLTTAAVVGSPVSGIDGTVSETTYAGSAGDIIEYTSAYPNTFRATLAESRSRAYEVNTIGTYVAENLYTPTTLSRSADFYAQDLDNPTSPPFLLARGVAGETTVIPYQTVLSKNLRIFPKSISKNYQQDKLDFNSSNYEDVAINKTSGLSSTLFDHFEDEATTGTIEETLYTDTIAGQTLYYYGDKISAEYAGVFAATADDKRIKLYFGGTALFDSGVLVESAKHWKLNLTLTRVNNTTIRTVCQFVSDVIHDPQYLNTTGLDLFDDNALVLKATDEVLGGTTAKMGYGIFIPGVATTTDYVTLFGEVVTLGGEPVTT
jgi:hypothetical protein